MDQPTQINLFDEASDGASSIDLLAWPSSARFPLNAAKEKVGNTVLSDLIGGASLIVTGYASLERIVEFLSERRSGDETIRLLFGSEPFATNRDSFTVREQSVPREAEAYWLDRGISLRLSAKVVKAVEAIRSGHVSARYLGSSHRRLHAKIYCGKDAVTVGSSNFTEPGFSRQLEANVRFAAKEKRRFEEACQIAENYWECGEDYTDQLVDLLERLLKCVTWEEALARSCAEILEGRWASEYLETQRLRGDTPLWPSQVEGIAQSLWLLENMGSVLVADATGSGKTRMGAHLIRAAVDRIWRSGRIRRGRSILLAPPAVAREWERETAKAGVQVAVRSHGSLSHASAKDRDDLTDEVRRAQVLAVDEAHNFLNLHSKRTQILLGNMADHNILFTATPINRGVTDLLRLVDTLGADNLEKSTLRMFEKLLRGRGKIKRTLTELELSALRKEIQRFTVRRTKKMLNELVDRNPEVFKDQRGRLCRYPRHESKMYSLSELDKDRERAIRIRNLADKLQGVALFVQPIEMPDVLAKEGWTEEKYRDMRLVSAKKLSGYLVMSALRSSTAALTEHIVGTAQALADYGIGWHFKKQPTGDMLTKLQSIAGTVPEVRLKIELPKWLTDPGAHRRACEEERKIYAAIHILAKELSGAREEAKLAHLVSLTKAHDLVIAFDSRPISVALFHHRLQERLGDDAVLMATGENAGGKKRILEALSLGSTRTKLIALCSDTMSEGVNLQQASAVVHLDMPSVVRIAEQRVGRVDRMDSPHEVIEAWWPDDAREFALRADDRFIERYETVETLIGSNMPLPTEMVESSESSKTLGAQEMIAYLDEAEERAPWDGIQDAFAPVRALVEGEGALVPKSIYQHYRDVKVKILSRVGPVRATSPWAFFCIAGTAIGAPRWIFLSSLADEPITDLMQISDSLRARLGVDVESLKMTAKAGDLLDKFLGRISFAERQLLPRRKQRALEEMVVVLNAYRDQAAEKKDQTGLEFLSRLLEILERPTVDRMPDWDAIAERWLDLIRPVWYERLLTKRRLRPLVLKDIRSELIDGDRLPIEEIIEAYREVPRMPTLDQRVVACILGVPN